MSEAQDAWLKAALGVDVAALGPASGRREQGGSELQRLEAAIDADVAWIGAEAQKLANATTDHFDFGRAEPVADAAGLVFDSVVGSVLNLAEGAIHPGVPHVDHVADLKSIGAYEKVTTHSNAVAAKGLAASCKQIQAARQKAAAMGDQAARRRETAVIAERSAACVAAEKARAAAVKAAAEKIWAEDEARRKALEAAQAKLGEAAGKESAQRAEAAEQQAAGADPATAAWLRLQAAMERDAGALDAKIAQLENNAKWYFDLGVPGDIFDTVIGKAGNVIDRARHPDWPVFDHVADMKDVREWARVTMGADDKAATFLRAQAKDIAQARRAVAALPELPVRMKQGAALRERIGKLLADEAARAEAAAKIVADLNARQDAREQKARGL